jgi:hypothetical protein
MLSAMRAEVTLPEATAARIMASKRASPLTTYAPPLS